MKLAGKVSVYCHSGVVQPRYSIRSGTPEPVQMPGESLAAVDKLSSQHLHRVQQPVLLSEKIGITGLIPRETSYEDTGGGY